MGTLALVGVFVCASAFVGTAKADDPPAAPAAGGTGTDGQTTPQDTTQTTPQDTHSDRSSGTSQPTSQDTTQATPPDHSAGQHSDHSAGHHSDHSGGQHSDHSGRTPLRPLRRTPTQGPLRRTPQGPGLRRRRPIARHRPRSLRPTPGPDQGSTPTDNSRDYVSTPYTAPPIGPARVALVAIVPTGRAREDRRDARDALDDRVSVGGVCSLAALAMATAAFDSARALVDPWSIRESRRLQSGSRSGGDSSTSRQGGAQQQPPIPPAPNHQPQGPGTPGALVGFSSSAGSHGAGIFGFVAILLGFALVQSTRLITPPKQRRRGLFLVLSLERPG